MCVCTCMHAPKGFTLCNYECCYYAEYVYIGIAVRLVGGSSYTEGRLEVYYHGEWGTACYYGWQSSNNYHVVCRQLGFGTYGYYSYFGQGSGPIWLDNVYCTGSESTLASCGILGVNVTRSCSTHQDVGIRCYGSQGMTA